VQVAAAVTLHVAVAVAELGALGGKTGAGEDDQAGRVGWHALQEIMFPLDPEGGRARRIRKSSVGDTTS